VGVKKTGTSQVNVRLPAVTVRQVAALRKKLGTASNAAVIVIAVDRLAQSP